MLVIVTEVHYGELTARASKGFAFLPVLGVFPRSFPGVLKTSATLLGEKSVLLWGGGMFTYT